MADKKDALAKPEQATVAVCEPENLTFEILRKYICPNATEQEMFLFQQVCVKQKLDPFKREVYFIKYNASDKAQIVVGYEVYLKRANALRALDGWETGVDYSVENGLPERAHITIYRKDWKYPFKHSVKFTEYIQRRSDGQITRMWKDKAETMIVKTVISQGFRLCFPEELGGMPYTADEMPAGGEALPTEPIVIETKQIEDAKPKIAGDSMEILEVEPAPVKEEPKSKPKPIVVPKADKPKPKESEPYVPKEGDMSLDEMKKGIVQMIDALEKTYGRKRGELVGKMHKRLVERFSVADINIPDQLTHDQASYVCDLLVLTLEAEEKKKKESEEVPF